MNYLKIIDVYTSTITFYKKIGTNKYLINLMYYYLYII